MIINMTTFAGRMTHYIGQTLESLFESDGRDLPINLILGSNDTSHVEQYRDKVNIVPWDDEAESLARKDNLRLNCTINAFRALQYGDDDYCLCCEDDIRFKPDWFRQLMLTIEEIGKQDYVLNLALGGDPSPDKRFMTDTRPYLCGAQALFYPSKRLRSTVAEYVMQKRTRSTNDDLVGRYAKEYAALYRTCPQLVAHIGQVTSFRQPKPAADGRTSSTSTAALLRRKTTGDGQEAKKADPGKGTVDSERERTKTAAQKAPAVGRRVDRVQYSSGVDLHRASRNGVGDRTTSEIVVELLRSSLGTGTPPGPDRLRQCSWGRFERIANHHGIGAILFRALREDSREVPPGVLRRLKAEYAINAFRSRTASAYVQEVGAAFATEEIRAIAMKGAALLGTLYDDPGLRVIGDVDLLVDERDVERAGALLYGLGLTLTRSDHEDQRGPLCHIHRIYSRPQAQAIPVELHWRLFEPYLPYVFDLNAVRAQARQSPNLPANVFVMAPEHELAHLCVHLDRHAVTFRSLVQRRDWYDLLVLPQGLGRLVWLYDIALYLQRRSALIDWDRFVDTSLRWVLDDRVHAALELSRRAFGIGPPPEVLRALNGNRPRIVERIAHQLVVASHQASEREASGMDGSEGSHWPSRLAAHALRFANTWMSIFPPDAYLRARYAAPRGALRLRSRHLREVVPGLWAETRDRMNAALAARRHAMRR